MNSDVHSSARARRGVSIALAMCLTPVVALCAICATAVPAQAGLVNYWAFDGDFFDTAGNYAGNTSTATDDMNGGFANFVSLSGATAGTTPRTSAGQIVMNSNDAVVFAGIPGTADVTLETHWTVGFWMTSIQMASGGANYIFSDTLGNNADNVRFMIWGNSTAGPTADEFRMNNSSGSPFNATPVTPSFTWAYWTIVQDGTNWSVYRDGQLLQYQPTSRTGATRPLNEQTLVIGNNERGQYNGTHWFANMSSWDNAMSDAEVMALYQNDGAPITLGVPEPASLTLAMLGLMGLGLAGWRKQRHVRF